MRGGPLRSAVLYRSRSSLAPLFADRLSGRRCAVRLPACAAAAVDRPPAARGEATPGVLRPAMLLGPGR